jgi:TonB family protein
VSESQFPSLQTIELGRADWTRWAGSLVVHVAFVGLVIAVPWAVHEEVQTRSEHVASLVDPAIPKPVVVKPAVKPVVVKRIPPPVITPVIVKPTIKFQAPKPVVTVSISPAKKIEVESSAPSPAPGPAPTEQVAVAKIEVPKPAPPVKVGGFGDPNGVQPSANPSPGKLVAAKTGSFDLSEGSARGKGSPGNKGGVALAGFGDGTAPGGSGTGGNGRGGVRSGGFGDYDSAPVATHPGTQSAALPVETPVEITFKPKPAYTAEARERKIEGEVLLEVIFAATGQIHVQRVMRGLGFGLDERARDAAAQIRFQPGTRAGSPVDMKGIVHIVFALS